MRTLIQKILLWLWMLLKWALITAVVLMVVIAVGINVPAVQQYAANKAATWFNNKTGGHLAIGHFGLRIPYHLQLENIELSSPEGSNILSIESLEVRLGWRKLWDKTVKVDYFEISGLKAHIYSDTSGVLNYGFILNAFAGDAGQPDETANPADTSGAWQFDLRKVALHRINLSYHDAATSDSASVYLGKFDLRMRTFSLPENTYEAEQMLLTGARVHVQLGPRPDMSAATAETDSLPDSNAALPGIAMDLMRLHDLDLYFTDLSDGSAYGATLESLNLITRSIDLDASAFDVKSLLVEGLQVGLTLPPSPPTTDPFDGDIFVPLHLVANAISLQNTGLTYTTVGAQSAADTLVLKEVNLQLTDVVAGPEQYALKLSSGGLVYGTLPKVSDLQFGASITPSDLSVSELRLRWGQSSLQGGVSVAYQSLAGLVNAQEFNTVSVDLPALNLHPADMAALLEIAQPDSALPSLPADMVKARLRVSGNRKALVLHELAVQSGNSRVDLAGRTAGAVLAEHRVSLSKLDFYADLNDLETWLPDSLDRGLLPAHASFAGKAKASPTASQLQGQLRLPYCDLELDFASGGWNSEVYNLEGSLYTSMLDLTSFAESDTFYTCFGIEVDLTDVAGDHMAGTVKVDIPEVRKDRLHVGHLAITDTINGDMHRFALSVNDSSLVATLRGSALLGDDLLEVDVTGDIPGVDFEYLGITRKDFRLRTNFTANYAQHDSTMYGAVRIDNSVLVRVDERIDLEPVMVSFYLGNDSTGIRVESEVLSVLSTSNLSVNELIAYSKDLFKDEAPEKSKPDGYWDFDFESGDSKVIRDALLPDLHQFEPAYAKVRYRAANRNLDASLMLPAIGYGTIAVDSVAMELNSKEGITAGTFSIKKIAVDTLAIERLQLVMAPDSAGTSFDLTIGDAPEKAPYSIGANLHFWDTPAGDYWQLTPSPILRLGTREWQVDPLAFLRFTESGTEISNLNLQRKDQQLRLSKAGTEETLHLVAQRFDLRSLAGIFAQDEALFGGILSAGVDLNSDGTFTGDGVIEQLEIANAKLGTFSFEGESQSNVYLLSANVDGGAIVLSAKGAITVDDEEGNGLDIKADLDHFSASALAQFFPSLVSSSSGEASGSFAVTGKSDAPQISGKLRFDGLGLVLKSGGNYTLRNEELHLEPGAIVFPNFAVSDSAGQRLVVNGRILHTNFGDMRYDLTIKSDRFTLLDVKPGDNPQFHGKLIVGTDVRITGTEARPIIRSDLALKRGSSMVFTVPESDYSEFKSDGLVEWTSFNDSAQTGIIGREKQQSSSASFTERIIDLAGNLNIDSETAFRIIIDPLAGDYLEIVGGGRLSLGYDRAGRINLAGTYTVSSGAYQMTFYNLVRRRFLLEPGSRITWNGDPFSADLNLTALYRTRASAMGLLNTGGATGAASESLRRMLDWEVVMLIEGELESPEIGFDLRLDKSSQASRGTVGGAVESRLVQLRENESELNMQVFALMVFNTFISEGGAGTSGSEMVTNQARNSASQLLTQQLNNLSDKLVGGVDLTFDLQSYGSEGATETDLSVDLSKTLFNDRVVVRVGSTVALENTDPLADNSQQMMTNFIVEYKVTTDGRYRLKAFRKTDVEDILVGRITRTGVGVVFRRSFDRGDQIFQKDISEKELDELDETERKRGREKKKQDKNEQNQDGREEVDE